MIVMNIFYGGFASGLTISISLVMLVIFGFYAMYPDKRQKQISLLPTTTKTYLEMIVTIIHVARLSPQDIFPYFSSVFKRVGPLVHFKIITNDYVVLNDPNDVKLLLSSTEHITKGPDYKLLEPWLNKGLLTSTDEKWQTRRKLLTNTFHFKILGTYIPVLNKHAHTLVQNLAKASKNDEHITDLYSHMTLCGLDIVCETIMGVSLRSQEEQSTDYVNAIKTVSRIIMKRMFTLWLWSDTIFKISTTGREFYKSLKVLHTFTENERKQKLNDAKTEMAGINGLERKKVYSFLDLLIGISKEHPSSMTDADIREEVDTFLFEGHDTSSLAMTMALIHIGMNQNIQDDIREELYGIFGDSDRDATMEDLRAMPILERVIKETMRLYPSVPGIQRKLNQPLHLKNHIIPAGSVVGIIIYLLHRDESMYPNPEAFNPDRFLPEHCNDRHPFGYIPFSAGPRNCIGQKFAMYQMKTVISTVVRCMKLETLGTQKDIVVVPEMVLRAVSLPSVKITPLLKK
ncbi:cytochrome P450 4C1-like isoform X2 [Adelges cooleyi]|uniref:cytochrome P450 4C1-like isoform X2 n=1 Tax=Adelges cooleyi TaxID=133065 RepID=UPI00217FC22D|nr:cytochrome P450 4C1-like isoform X2 [Adelges cooleyi]